jgi:hypothetical protein
VAHSTGLSFAASTLVETPKGQQAIASLKVGDQVIAYDPETGKATTQTVQRVFLNHDTDLLNVTLHTTAKSAQRTTSPAVDPACKQRLAAVASHGSHAPPTMSAKTEASTTTASGDETIHTTANHPWLSADRGWVVAGKLHLAEQVLRADGSVAEVVALTTVHGTAPMWDLTISNVHDFAVGVGAYVVHNCDFKTFHAKNGHLFESKEESRAVYNTIKRAENEDRSLWPEADGKAWDNSPRGAI